MRMLWKLLICILIFWFLICDIVLAKAGTNPQNTSKRKKNLKWQKLSNVLSHFWKRIELFSK